MTTEGPRRTPSRIVGLAVGTLPAANRDRYLLEFMAELHFTPPEKQLRYALRVLVRSLSLRAALSGASSNPIVETTMMHPRARLHCRLNLWHHWRTFSADDGGRYRACHQCGRERATGYIHPGTTVGFGGG